LLRTIISNQILIIVIKKLKSLKLYIFQEKTKKRK
jgi:hypothetical protein